MRTFGQVNVMVRSFSLASNSIPYFLGMSLLRTETVIIVSPWISDIEVKFPVSRSVPKEEMDLAEALHWFEEGNYYIVTSSDPHNEYLIDRVKDTASVTVVDDLHAKAIITDDLIYVGSANITRRGMSENLELCHVMENQYNDSELYLNMELGIELDG